MYQHQKSTTTGQGMNDNIRSINENTSAKGAKGGIGIGWVVFVAAVLLMAPAIGSAQSVGEQPDSLGFVDRFDQNGDASVSQEEFPGPDEHFSQLDSDGDGFIDAGEAPNGPPEGKEGNGGGFEQDDQDNDDRVSQAEFSGPSDHFDQLDQDQDGYIDRDEGSRGPRGDHGGDGGRGPRN